MPPILLPKTFSSDLRLLVTAQPSSSPLAPPSCCVSFFKWTLHTVFTPTSAQLETRGVCLSAQQSVSHRTSTAAGLLRDLQQPPSWRLQASVPGHVRTSQSTANQDQETTLCARRRCCSQGLTFRVLCDWTQHLPLLPFQMPPPPGSRPLSSSTQQWGARVAFPSEAPCTPTAKRPGPRPGPLHPELIRWKEKWPVLLEAAGHSW